MPPLSRTAHRSHGLFHFFRLLYPQRAAPSGTNWREEGICCQLYAPSVIIRWYRALSRRPVRFSGSTWGRVRTRVRTRVCMLAGVVQRACRRCPADGVELGTAAQNFHRTHRLENRAITHDAIAVLGFGPLAVEQHNIAQYILLQFP